MAEDRPAGTDALRLGIHEPPTSLTRFIGRRAGIAKLRDLLQSCRLVTLTGSGGSGKTRLAQELAADVASAFPGGVFWVELSPIQDGALVPEQVAEALGIPNRRGDGIRDAIVTRISDARSLLVIDNCEHVVRHAAELTAALLGRCRNLVVLATSREALAVPGETAWLVPPLSLPDPDTPLSEEVVRESEAVSLFLDRASEVLPTFRLSAENITEVVAICRRLDGIPLAVELAAARLRALGPGQLLERLDDRFTVLTTRTRTALPRHRTLRATIDWSYDLLPAEERRLLDSLSVFSGTFDLDSVEQLCADDVTAAIDLLDLLSELVEKSLVEVVELGSHVRYRLLETVRRYAEEKLRESGRDGDMVKRHAEYFLALAQTAEPHFTRPGRRQWLDRLKQDADNLRQALLWTRREEPAAHVRLVASLGWYWFGTEHWSEGRRWLEEAHSLPEASESPRDRAAILFGVGMLSALQGRGEAARAALAECVAIARDLGAPRLGAYGRLYLGLSLASEGRGEAIPHLEAALSYFREDGDLYGERLSYLCLGAAAAAGGDLDRASELTASGLAAAREFGQDREFAVSLRQLSIVELRRGNPERAASLAGDALEALSRDPQHYFISMALEVLAGALVDLGRHAEAARLFGAGERVREGIGVAVAKIDAPVYEPRIATLRSSLGAAGFTREWAAGRALSTAAAVFLGRELGGAVPHLDEGEAAPTTGSGSPPAPPPTAPAESGTEAPTTTGLDVAALGPLVITLDGEPIDPGAWSHSRPRELLLFLLCRPDGRTRQEVGEALWPDSTPAQVKNSFHVTLHHLRKTLRRPGWVRFDNERYVVEESFGVRFDAREFEQRMRSARRLLAEDPERGLEALRAALRLYRGDFLAGETIRDWHLEYRDHLRRLWAEGTLVVGDALLELGELESAVDAFKRVVLIDDLHEGAHRRLMTAYARAGERQRAVRVFERLTALLRDELSAEPEVDTVELHRRILAAEPV